MRIFLGKSRKNTTRFCYMLVSCPFEGQARYCEILQTALLPGKDALKLQRQGYTQTGNHQLALIAELNSTAYRPRGSQFEYMEREDRS